MRASSLSNDKVINLLNHFFVPVYLSNEDFAKGGCAPAEEKKELQRIFRETLDAKRSAGTVHVYLLAPDGKSSTLPPAGCVEKGQTWQPDAAVAARLLTHFYPTTENNSVEKNKIHEQELKAAVVSLENGSARAQLTGHLVMDHWFYHKADG